MQKLPLTPLDNLIVLHVLIEGGHSPHFFAQDLRRRGCGTLMALRAKYALPDATWANVGEAKANSGAEGTLCCRPLSWNGRPHHEQDGASNGLGQSRPGSDQFPQSGVKCIGFCSARKWKLP
jgi:hypothetical protein